MIRIVLSALALLSACAGPAASISQSSEGKIFEANFEDVAAHDVTKFDIRVSADVPPWRIWNFVFTDPKRLAQATSGEAGVTRFEFVSPTEVELTAEIDVVWFLPNREVKARWLVHPESFSWEQQCVEGFTRDCYIRGSFSPLDGGARTLVRYQGYIRRPWYASHAQVAESMLETFVAAQTGISLVAQQPAFGNRNAKYPWDELNAFSSHGAEPAPAPATAAARPKLLVQDFVVSSADLTDTTVIRLASTYLAERLAESRRFDVLTDWDVRVMAKYLQADWQLSCNHERACTEKLLTITKAKYVLAGEVARAAGRYTVSFVVMDAESLTPRWRYNREIAATSAELRTAVAEAAAQFARTL